MVSKSLILSSEPSREISLLNRLVERMSSRYLIISSLIMVLLDDIFFDISFFKRFMGVIRSQSESTVNGR